MAARLALTGSPFATDFGVPAIISQPATPEGRAVLAERFADRMAGSGRASTEDNEWSEDEESIDRERWPRVRLSRDNTRFVIEDDEFEYPPTDAQGSRRSSLDDSMANSMHSQPGDMVEPEDSQNRRRIADADVSVFSDVRELIHSHVDAEGRPVLLDLTCMICNVRPIEVPEEIAPRRPGYQRYHPEAFVVLPCGHFMGGRCYARWHSVNVQEHSRPHCPLCRFNMDYPACHHSIPLIVADTETPVPLTIAEGGQVPQRCSECDPSNPEGSW